MLSGTSIPLAAYMYSTQGSTGIPTLAAQLVGSSAVSEVYLKAFDIDGTGAVFPKTDSQTPPGNFYPHYWTGSPTPTPIPTFTALINGDPANPYSSDPTTTVQNSLTANAWTTQFGGGITIDSEFFAGDSRAKPAIPAVTTFPEKMQSFFTNMRVFANTASQSFSFYFNPKYLDSTRYTQQIVTANTASLKAILGTNPRNTVLFPVYADTNSQATQTTLQAGAYAAFSQGVGYKWIMDITQTPSVFADGITSLNTIGQTPSGANLKGAVAYQYIDSVTVTPSMKANLATLSNLGLPALPGAPTIASVTSGPGQLGVSWLAPNNSGSPPVSEYLVKYSSNNGSSWTRFQPSTGPITALSCTVTGLTNGNFYVIKVIAKSALGIGPPSVNSAPSTPVTVPGAPTILSAVPSAGQIAVAWNAPASTGGSNITDYVVKISTNSGTTWTRVTRPVSAARSHIITGLAGGASYWIKVIAKNAFGISPPSVNAVSVAAATVPGKPTAVVAVSGNAQLAVTWAAPVNIGGSPITDYLVKYSSNSGATWKNFIHPPLTATSLTVTGLTNNTSYVIKVIAKNAIGISLPSLNSAPATPAIPLPAPVLRPKLQVSHFGQDIPWVAQTYGVSSINMDKYSTPGSGYTAATAPTVTLDAPTGVGGVTATATAWITNGTITGITVPASGFNLGGAWSLPPTVTVSPAPSASGTPAVITVHQNPDGTIQYFNVSTAGEGYAGGSTLSLVLTPAAGDTTHSGPFTATGLTITTASGTVGGIKVKNSGSGYGAAQIVGVSFGSVPGATPPTGVTATVAPTMAPSQALFKAWATDYITFLVNTKIGTAFINIGDYSQIADKFSYLDPNLGTNGVPWIVTDFLDPLSKVVDANGSPVDIEVGALPYLDASDPFHLYGPGDEIEDPKNPNFAGNTFITDGLVGSPPKNNMYQAMQLINDINKMSTNKFITHLEFDGEGGGMFRDDTVYGFNGNQANQVPPSDWTWDKQKQTGTWPTTGAGYTKWLWNHFMPGVASTDLANGGDMPGSGRTGPIASSPDVVYTDQEAVTRSTWNPTATPSTPPAPYQFGAMAYGAPAWPTLNGASSSLSWGPQQAYAEFYWFGELTYKPGPGSSLLTETTPKNLDSQTPALPWISTTDTTVYSNGAPAIVFHTPPKGRPAAGYAVLKSDNTIDYIAITRLGDGYTTASPPTYSINNGTVRYPVVITNSSTNGIDPKYGKEFAPIFTKDTGGFISSNTDITFTNNQYTQAGAVLTLANATSSATHALGTLPPGWELIQKGMAVTGTGVAAGTTVVSVQVTQSPLTVSITLSSTPVSPGALTFASTGINLVNIVDHGAGYSMGAKVTDAGTGYTTAPTVTFTAPSPSVPNAVRATGVAVLSNGGVGSIQITNPGFGYTSEPTITFSGGGGTNATAEAHILNYPRVTIAATSPNTGSGAVAYAVVIPTAKNGPYDPDTGYSVSSIAFTNPGSGYFTATDSTSGNYSTLPTIVFSTPTAGVGSRTATAEGGLVPVVALNAFWLDGANAIGSTNELGTLDPTTNPSVLESVGQVTIAAAGSGYDARATVSFTAPASGDTATGYVVVNASGGVERIAITNPGSGYSATSLPGVTIAGNGGTGSGASVSVVATDLVPRIRGGGNSINWNLWDGTGQPGSNLNLFSQNAAQTTYSYYSSYPQSLAQMFGDPLYAAFGPPKLNDVFYQPLNVGQDSSSSVAGGQGAIASFSLEGILRSNTGPAATALGGNADSMDAHYQVLSTQPGTTSPLVAFNSLGGTFSGLSSLTYVDFVTFLNSAADIVVGSQKTALNGIQFASSTDYSAVAGTVTFTGSQVTQSTLAIGKGMTVEGPGIPVGTTVTGVTETLTGTTITSLVITLSNSTVLPTGSLCFYTAFTAEDVTFAIYDIAFIPYSWISSNSKVANSWTITA